ncbi:MAG: hypothetical protein AAGE98_09510 [Actinomycetota bacterium]
MTTAAVFVALYALAAAWIVIADGESPPSVALHRTGDGQGVVITGAVPDDDQRIALVDAVGEVTGAVIVVADITVDPDAEPIGSARATATELLADLPPGPRG